MVQPSGTRHRRYRFHCGMHGPRHEGIFKALLLACAVGIASAALREPPAQSLSPVESRLVAGEIKGLGVFSADGQRVGRVASVNVTADGTVKDVEVRSPGFLGFFSKTYVVPADKLSRRGGRLDLSLTSSQTRAFNK
jgi:hypothetical protein